MTQQPQKQLPAQQPKGQPTLGEFLSARRGHLAEVLPKSSALTAEKIIKLALLATKKNSLLGRCNMDTVFQSLLQCAELGLDPGGATGEAYLVPYSDTCNLIIGYRGYIKLARNSGVLKQIETHVVHERDKFTLRYGLEPKLEHEPCLTGDPGAPIVVYCVARLADGAVHVEVMTMAEIHKIRDVALSRMPEHKQKSSPWTLHFEEQARKTVVRRTAKYLPMSPELQRALEIEDEAVDGEVVQRSDAAAALAPTATGESQTDKVKALIARTKAPTAAVIDVKAGETEEEAVARVKEGPPEPPPLTEADMPFAPEAGS
jgi:recombination protein RecT